MKCDFRVFVQSLTFVWRENKYKKKTPRPNHWRLKYFISLAQFGIVSKTRKKYSKTKVLKLFSVKQTKFTFDWRRKKKTSLSWPRKKCYNRKKNSSAVCKTEERHRHRETIEKRKTKFSKRKRRSEKNTHQSVSSNRPLVRIWCYSMTNMWKWIVYLFDRKPCRWRLNRIETTTKKKCQILWTLMGNRTHNWMFDVACMKPLTDKWKCHITTLYGNWNA